jgi:putative transcriptional regulator
MIRNTVYELRSLARMTQEELAKAVGVTRQTIISLEKNKYVPSLELGFRIAELFGKRVDEVFSHGWS